jgi:hypothetical protein
MAGLECLMAAIFLTQLCASASLREPLIEPGVVLETIEDHTRIRD